MRNYTKVLIEELKTSSPEVVAMINHLIAQLDSPFQKLTDHDVQSIIGSHQTHLFVARLFPTYNIIGMVTLVVYRIPFTMKGQLEDLVVDDQFRGQGIGTQLIQYAIQRARELGVKSLNLTSRPSRVVANRLYERLGFEKRDTNVYRINL